MRKSSSYKKYKDKKSNDLNIVFSAKAKSFKKLKNPKIMCNSDTAMQNQKGYMHTVSSDSHEFKYMKNNQPNKCDLSGKKLNALVYSIKMAVGNKKNEIRELLNASPCQYTVDQFKSLIARHLYELAQTVFSCISATVSNTKQPIVVNENSIGHLNRVLIIAYINLVDNIENFIFQLNSQVNSEYFRQSLNKIYLDLVQQPDSQNESFGQCIKHEMSYYSEPFSFQQQHQSVVLPKPINDTNKILCTVSEMKILHFTLFLFSHLASYDDCAPYGGLDLLGQCDPSQSAGIVCLKVINQLIDMLCADKIVKRKILLNLSEFDRF